MAVSSTAPHKNGSAVWKWLTFLQTGVIVSGLGTYLVYGSQSMTRSEIQALVHREIERAPYPWLSDRALVMDHLTNSMVHEDDSKKRMRIRQEVEVAQKGVMLQLEAIKEMMLEFQRLLIAKNGAANADNGDF